MDTKLCRWCDPQQEKPVTEFYKNKRTKDGLSNKCKECESRTHQVYYRTKKSHRKSSLKLNYKITIKQFNEMYREQGGLCAICKVEGAKMVVDHDHLTGAVRGLLCNSCNHALGRFRDNVTTLRSAIEYLEKKHG